MSAIDLEENIGAQANTALQELASCNVDLDSAVEGKINAHKAEEDLRRRLDATDSEVADAGTTIAWLEKEVKQEAVMSRRNAKIAEDAAEKARLRHTFDNAKCRREMKTQQQACSWHASRAASECRREFRRAEDEWNAQAVAYEEEVSGVDDDAEGQPLNGGGYMRESCGDTRGLEKLEQGTLTL